MELYLVRHGLSRHNLENPAECPYDPLFDEIEDHDPSLTPQGEIQADLTGQRLKQVQFDAVLVSPFHRTLSTAAGILRHQAGQLCMEIMPALAECGTSPEFRMMPEHLRKTVWPDIREAYPYDLPVDSDHSRWLRARRVADTVRKRFAGNEKVLIVSHGHFMAYYLLSAFLGLSEEQANGRIFGAENCGITKFLFREDGVIVAAAMDETGHLGSYVSREPFDITG